METYSLLELNEYIRRVIALNFEEPIWVNCEISQAKQSRRHFYLDLVEKDTNSDTILAQSSAVLWSSKYGQLYRKFGDVLNEVLQDGVEVRIQIKVDFHERYGLKLVIEDVDPTYTMGNLELRRREILEELYQQGLTELNKTVPAPLVPQRIAVLSAETAAGYQDFMQHLRVNPYGYHFDVHLYPVAVQGQNVETEVVAALEEVGRVADHYDCVVIIRGGGSRLDLSGFDNFEIGKSIAHCPLPVFTGIGHEIDQSVADVVAHTSLKTPTAVADHLVELISNYEYEVDSTYQAILDVVSSRINKARSNLAQSVAILSYAPRHMISSRRTRLEDMLPRLVQLARTKVYRASLGIEKSEAIVKALEPKAVLARGFSITRVDGKTLIDPDSVATGTEITTELAKGRIISRVIK